MTRSGLASYSSPGGGLRVSSVVLFIFVCKVLHTFFEGQIHFIYFIQLHWNLHFFYIKFIYYIYYVVKHLAL